MTFRCLKLFLSGLSISLTVGCGVQSPGQPTQQQFNIPTNPSPIPTNLPTALPPQFTGSVPPQPSRPITPQPNTSGNTTQNSIFRNTICEADYHVASIAWQQGQPFMTFYRKPNTVLLNPAPVQLTRNTDGSQTYSYQSTTTTTATFYGDGSCQLQVTGPNDSLTIQETGRASFSANSPSGGGGSTSMTCRGSLSNTVNFIVYYTQNLGFYRVEFYPPSGVVIAADLVNAGATNQGQRIWQGTVNNMAAVIVTHLSTGIPQRGDQIFVQYDASRGTGVCGGLSALW